MSRRRVPSLRVIRSRLEAWSLRTGLPQESFIAFPGLVAAGVFVAFAADEGGFAATTWLPGAIFLVVLAAVATGAQGSRLRVGWPVLAAVAALAAFVGWNFLSIAWADNQGLAYDGANRALLYLAVFALFALWPWRPRGAAAVLGVFGLAIAAVGGIEVSQAAGAADPTEWLIKGRFAEPVGYPNGNAALFLVAAWPLLHLSARRDVPWLARGLTLGGVGALVELALISQSRGSVLAGALTLVVYLALVPGRVRSLISIAAVAAAVLLSLDALLDVFTVAEAQGDVGGALSRAGDAIALTFVALFGVGALIGLIDARAPIPGRVRRGGHVAIAVIAAAGAVCGLVGVLVVSDDPVGRVENKWDEFKAGQPTEFRQSRFSTGLGSARYEYWRIAMREFENNPIAGIGSENFAIPYVRERESPADEPLFVHSFQVGVISQTGVVGAALFVAFLAFALLAFWRTRAASDGLRRGLACVGVVTFAYWFAHAAGDWLWELPAVTAPAIAWLGMAAGLAERRRPAETVSGRTAGWALPAATGLAAVAAIAVLVPPWLAARDVNAAAGGWTADRGRAYDQLDRARSLNPFSDDADIVHGTIASIAGDRRGARLAFARAAERTPKAWYPHQQLGIEDALAGDRAAAIAQLRTAIALNPLEETSRDLLGELSRGDRPSPTRIRERLTARTCARVPSVGGCR